MYLLDTQLACGQTTINIPVYKLNKVGLSSYLDGKKMQWRKTKVVFMTNTDMSLIPCAIEIEDNGIQQVCPALFMVFCLLL